MNPFTAALERQREQGLFRSLTGLIHAPAKIIERNGVSDVSGTRQEIAAHGPHSSFDRDLRPLHGPGAGEGRIGGRAGGERGGG